MHPKNVAYDKSKIRSVTRAALEYVDDQGIACTIDFHACHENVQKELRSPGWLQVKESQDIYVGFRDFGARPPHITLATDPPTCFRFPMPKPAVAVPGQKFLRRGPEDFRDFIEFQTRLMEVGLKTLDMA